MNKIVVDIFKVLILTVIFVLGIILPTMIIPVSSELASRVTGEMQNNIFKLLLLVSLFGAVALMVTVKLSKWNGIKLMLALGLSFWGIEYFMAQIETFYFREAFTYISNKEIVNIMLRGVITTLIIIPFSVLLFGKLKSKIKINIKDILAEIEIKNWVKKAFIFSILYIILYLIFGYYVAWQFEAVRVFYSGSSEQLTFINQIVSSINDMPFYLPYHFIRGFLWVVFAIPIIMIMNNSRKNTMIALMLIFAYHGFQIIMAHNIFPPDVLIGHTIETTISACIYGGLIAYMFSIPDIKKRTEC